MRGPPPASAEDLEESTGPVLVTVEYRIAVKDRRAFLAALERVAFERRRDGAYAWGIFEDVAEPGRLLETFLVESWMEHLRQHERVTVADQLLQERMQRLLLQPEKITHFITADPDREPPIGTGDDSASA